MKEGKQMIMGIVGSPRKRGLTDQLVTGALEGAKSAGLETEKVHLADFEVPFYSEEAKCPQELSEMCEGANALVIGAPVYYGDISGLTKDFMDTVSISNANGKHGLGISIAGGTGKGLCLAVQSIYSFFYHRQIRGIDPTPVSRFNFKKIQERLYASGKKLAELSQEAKPFQNLWDRIEHYEKLPYLKHTFLDEILLLVEQLIGISANKPALAKAKQEYEIAKSLINQGKRLDSVKHAVKAYDTLYF
jgi:NAD(P)H-dependent FMN reductase